MKGIAKRVICLFLVTIIVVTTAGYAPPSFALTAMSNSKMEEAEEIVAEVATPLEAESPEDKAAPSETIKTQEINQLLRRRKNVCPGEAGRDL